MLNTSTATPDRGTVMAALKRVGFKVTEGDVVHQGTAKCPPFFGSVDAFSVSSTGRKLACVDWETGEIKQLFDVPSDDLTTFITCKNCGTYTPTSLTEFTTDELMEELKRRGETEKFTIRHWR
jgi:hypothetical protein